MEGRIRPHCHKRSSLCSRGTACCLSICGTYFRACERSTKKFEPVLGKHTASRCSSAVQPNSMGKCSHERGKQRFVGWLTARPLGGHQCWDALSLDGKWAEP